MKKVFYLLLVALVMVGCGGAGTSTTSETSGDGSGGGGGGTTISGPVGTIRVVFRGSGPAPSAPVLLNDNVTLLSPYTTGSLGEELGFRVSVSKYVTDNVLTGYTKVYDEDDIPTPIYKLVTTRTFFTAIDNTASEITIKVPVDNGYLLEVVSYDKDPKDPGVAPPFQMRRYGFVDNLTVRQGAQTVTLGPTATQNGRAFTPIADDTILFSRSEIITAGYDYTMKVTYNSKVPLRDNFNFADNISNNFVFNDANIDNTLKTIGVTFTSKAPVPPFGPQDNNIYFQGQFYINNSMLWDDEISKKMWKNFRLNAPALYNNAIQQLLYSPGELNIVID